MALLGFHLIGLVGFNLILRKSLLAKVDRFTLATILQTGIAIPAFVLLIARPPHIHMFSAIDYVYVFCAVALTIGLQTTNVKSLQYLEASAFSMLYNLRIMLTTAIGIVFLEEAIVGMRIIGDALILLAIIIVKQQSSHSVRVRGIVWGMAAAVAISLLNLTEKLLIINVGFLNYFPLVSVLAGIFMWAFILISKREFNTTILRQPRMIQLMTLRAISAYGFSGALAAGV